MALSDRLVNDVALPVRRLLTRDVYRSPERTRRHVERRALRPASFAPPRRIERHARLEVDYHREWRVYHLWPKSAPATVDVLYLHGGAYINEIVAQHWSLIGRLVREARAHCVTPIYSLAPRGTAERVVADASALAEELIAHGTSGRTALVGDSAGGGMALAVALALRDRGLRQPERLVLISPWLDVTMSDPGQAELEPRDRMLRQPGLAEAGRLYAGDLPVEDPRVSPINGDLMDLPPITLFIGTHDLLLPDSQRLVRAAERAGVEVETHVVDGAPHVFPLLPTRQGEQARTAIVRRLQHRP